MRRFVSLVLGLLVLPAVVWGQAQVINGNRVHAGWVNYGITAGTATAYTLTFTPALQGYVAGQCFLIKPHLTNTGAATLNVQGLGAKPLKKRSGGSLVPVVADDLPADRLQQVCYDGTDFQLMGTAPDAAAGLVCDGVTQVAAAIQTLLDTVPVGTRIELPPGVCLLNQALTITRTLTLEGAGMEHTFLTQTVADLPVLTASAVDVHIRDLTVMHTGTPVAGGDGLIVRGPGGVGLNGNFIRNVMAKQNWRGFVLGGVYYAQMYSVWALHNDSHGFEFVYDAANGGVMQWDIIGPSSQLNKGAGFFGNNTAATNGIGPWITQAVSFGNEYGGFSFNGNPGFPISDLRFTNVIASMNNRAGIYLNTFGGAHILIDPNIELTGLNGGLPMGSAGTPSVATNTGDGLIITVNNTYGVMISGGTYWNNAWSGIHIGAPSTQLIGGQTVGNGKALAPEPHRRASVYIGADNVLVNGHHFQFVGDGGILSYIDIYPPVSGTIIGPNSFAPGLPAIPMRGPGGGGSTASITCDGATVVSAQIQALLDTVPVGTKVVLPPGVCLLNATLTISKTLTLEGAGINHTILRQTVPNIPVIAIGAANDVYLGSFTADHQGTTPVAGGDGVVVNNLLNHAYIEHVQANYNWRGFVLGCVAFGYGGHLEASNNNSHGFEFLYPAATCGAAQWQIHHTLSQLNRGAGFGGFNYPPGGSANGIGPFLDHTHSFGNNQGGYFFQGTPGRPINDLWLLHVASSSDNVAGIYLDTRGVGHVISNPWVELTGTQSFPQGWPATSPPITNAGNCVSVTENNLQGLVIMGGFFWNCADSTVALYAPFSSLIGGASIGPGYAMSPTPSKRANVSIGANGVIVSGHSFSYYAPGALSYINLEGNLTQISIGHNSYSPGLDPSQYVNSVEASLSAVPPTMAGGVTLHTNTAAAPGVYLYDATGGANPLKVLRVTTGQLQILNSAGAAIIQSLSDAGTPGWPNRRGQLVITGGTNTGTVTLAPGEPDTAYFTQVTVVGTTPGSDVGALTIVGVTKAAESFTLTVAAPPGAGKSVVYDWLVHR